MKLDFATVDVFTDQQFGGNPLAVVLNADGLSSDQMQKIAAEFDYAETTFVLPPKSSANTAHVRIFTPRAEMPFAGHPNIGTAYVLAAEGESYGRPIAGDRLAFEEIAGLVRIEVLRDRLTIAGARLTAPQPFTRGETIPLEVAAAACGISVADIATGRHEPCVASCGAPFGFVELKERRALAAARPNKDVFTQNFDRARMTGIHLYVQAPADGVDIQSRMFAPLHGVDEDPATGSANVALAGLLAQLRQERDLSLAVRIGQGFDMGRPSILDAQAEKKAGVVTATYIGGSCAPMMRGALTLR
jgi:trans-2,3-dihydro-3-hydroxyanthranilate isomerase